MALLPTEPSLLIAQTYYSTIWKSNKKINGTDALIKHFHHQEDPRTLVRFHDEVRALTRVGTHPNITQLLSSSPTDLTLTLTLAPGHSLSSYHPIDLTLHTQTICLHLSRALSHIHSLDLIHDDIKPANIVFLAAPDPRASQTTLVDFGACIEAGRFTPSGTPWYTAPEFVRRLKGPWTDVWALGVTMAWVVGELGEEVPENVGDEWILPHVWTDPNEMAKMDAWLAVVEGVRGRMAGAEGGLASVVADMLCVDYERRVSTDEVLERLEEQERSTEQASASA